MGIDEDYLVVDQAQLLTLLMCGICRGVMDRPSEVPCHHKFCTDCLVTWCRNLRGASKTCPVCRHVFNENQITLIHDTLLNGVIGTLTWVCEHVGCGATVPIADREVHMRECPFFSGKWHHDY